MDQYLYIPFLVGWTSIYQLFWCSPGVQGFDTLPCFEGKTLRRSLAAMIQQWLPWAATQEREALPSWGITTTWLRSLEISRVQHPLLCKVQIWNDGTLWDILWGNMWWIYYRIHNIYIYIYVWCMYIYIYGYGCIVILGYPFQEVNPCWTSPLNHLLFGQALLGFSTLTVSYWNHGPSK